jgi:hypothetical protein
MLGDNAEEEAEKRGPGRPSAENPTIGRNLGKEGPNTTSRLLRRIARERPDILEERGVQERLYWETRKLFHVEQISPRTITVFATTTWGFLAISAIESLTGRTILGSIGLQDGPMRGRKPRRRDAAQPWGGDREQRAGGPRSPAHATCERIRLRPPSAPESGSLRRLQLPMRTSPTPIEHAS